MKRVYLSEKRKIYLHVYTLSCQKYSPSLIKVKRKITCVSRFALFQITFFIWVQCTTCNCTSILKEPLESFALFMLKKKTRSIFYENEEGEWVSKK